MLGIFESTNEFFKWMSSKSAYINIMFLPMKRGYESVVELSYRVNV